MATSSATILTPAKAATIYRPIAVDRGEAFAAVAQLGSRDAVCTLWSDSTGNESVEWFRMFVNAYAPLHPKARVLYYLWSDTTKAYGAATEIQAGASSTAVTTPIVDTFTRTAADLKGSTADSGQAWGGDTNSTGDWSLDGAKAIRTADTTGSYVTMDAIVKGDQRLSMTNVVLDTTTPTSTRTFLVHIKRSDNANHLVFELRVTTTGVITAYLHKRIANTYTTLVSSPGILTAGAATPFDLVFKNEGTAVTASVNGTLLTATLTDAELATIAGGSQVAMSATNQTGMTIAGLEVQNTGTGQPEQTLHFYCGALSGSNLDYQVANLNAITPAATDLLILNSIHNNAGTLGPEFVTKLDAWVAAARTRVPGAGIVVSSQNPQKAPAGGANAHYARNVAARAAALARGWGYMPVMEAFRGRGDGGASYVKDIDGVHPTTSADAANPNNGSALWSRVALDYFAKLEQPVIA